MSEVTAIDIQKLRQTAGVGMMDAKKALTDAAGDFDKAFELLRERGQAQMAKRADREANEGTIGTYLHEQNGRPVLGVMIELACETDFVAKSDEFRQVAADVAMHISWGAPGWLQREHVEPETLEKERDLIARQAAAEGKPEKVIDKIVEGKIESWYADNVLYDQKFVNSDKFDGSVGEMISQLATRMGENISVRRMSRIAVGE
jgi:elongation factor Ts